MKKIVFLLMLCLSLSFCLSSCVGLTVVDGGTGNVNTEKPELSVEYVYSLAKDAGYTGTINQFVGEFKGEKGSDGVGILGAAFNEDAHLILTLTNGKTVDCGKIMINVNSNSSLSIGDNGNWYIDGEDTGKRAVAKDGAGWHTGSGAPLLTLGGDGDLYLDTATCDVYKKSGGVWTLVANITGEINEGDDYNVTVNAGDANYRYAAAKALMSGVRVESIFVSQSSFYNHASNGAGVIYKLDKEAGNAYVITNFHVVYDANYGIADKINLYLYGMEYSNFAIEAEYVGGAMNYDVAVLKVTGSEILKNSAVAAAEIVDSENVEILDTAIAVGNPASAGISVTLGSVSVKSEHLKMTAPDNLTQVEYRVMRIDTPINNGNSGGGLFNSEGKLIGIVSAKERDVNLENMGYAIPSNLAVYVTENIIRNCDGKTNDKVILLILGMDIKVAAVKSEYNTEKGVIKITETCVIDGIETGSVAEIMFMTGDVVKSIEIDGKTYEVRHSYDTEEILLNATLTSEIYINVERGGTPLRVELEVSNNNFYYVP